MPYFVPATPAALVFNQEAAVCIKPLAGEKKEIGPYYIRWRLKLEGETENMGVCTKERKGVTAAVLMATPCTNSLGGDVYSIGHWYTLLFFFVGT